MASATARARCSGGKGRPAAGSLAADDSQRAGERQPVGVQAAVGGCLVYQRPDGVVDQQHPPHLLLDQLGGAGAQHHAGAALVGLEFIQRGLNPPSRMHL
jgi:hypothetical protein